MAFSPTNVEGGVFDSIEFILDGYTDSDDINNAIYGDLSAFNIDEDVEDALQNYTINNTSFWDQLYIADTGEYVGQAISGAVLDFTGNTFEANAALSLVIKNEVKALITESVSIKVAVTEYFESTPIKSYITKATGLIVRSETILSETTHIPIGKFLSGAAHGITAYTIYEAFKDTITASYNATLGQEDLPIQLRQLGQLGVDGVEFW
jgi:hypothetical protein